MRAHVSFELLRDYRQFRGGGLGRTERLSARISQPLDGLALVRLAGVGDSTHPIPAWVLSGGTCEVTVQLVCAQVLRCRYRFRNGPEKAASRRPSLGGFYVDPMAVSAAAGSGHRCQATSRADPLGAKFQSAPTIRAFAEKALAAPATLVSDGLGCFTAVQGTGTVFSTVAMVVYPSLLRALELSPTEEGIFLDGMIHKVAQVVAAGMIVRPEAADTATIVKLLRVLLLIPVVLTIAMVIRARTPAAGVARVKTPLVPAFLVTFVVLVTAGSVGALPRPAISAAVDASRWLMVVAIAAAVSRLPFRPCSNSAGHQW
jgi:Conserved hypothetical protein 698